MAIVLACAESGCQVLDPGADEKVSQRSDAGAPAEVVRADGVIGAILSAVRQKITIAKAEAVREPAACCQRTELGMKALPVDDDDEDRLVLGEPQPPLEAVRTA